MFFFAVAMEVKTNQSTKTELLKMTKCINFTLLDLSMSD